MDGDYWHRSRHLVQWRDQDDAADSAGRTHRSGAGGGRLRQPGADQHSLAGGEAAAEHAAPGDAALDRQDRAQRTGVIAQRGPIGAARGTAAKVAADRAVMAAPVRFCLDRRPSRRARQLSGLAV